jgi:hypothetical protein
VKNKDFSLDHDADHLRESHPVDNKDPVPVNGRTSSPTTTARESHTRTGSNNSTSSASKSVGGTPRKVSLKNKIKGEVKVISGKLGGNLGKVEEGRRILKGEGV